MAQSQISIQTYNGLYSALKSGVSQKGTGFNLKTFNDGSAVVHIIITARNVSVELAAVVIPLLDENGKVCKYRVADDNYTKTVMSIQACVSFIRSLIAEARSVLNKV